MNVFQSITEGGQLTTHSVRMFKQVTKTSIFLAVLLWMSVFIYQMRDIEEFYLRCIWYHEQARLHQALEIKTIDVNQQFWLKLTGKHNTQALSTERVRRETGIHATFIYRLGWFRFKQSGLIALAPFSIILVIFFLRGQQSKKKHHLKGNKLASVWLTAWKLKFKGVASKISIGPLPLVKGTETQHILITGGTGSGKTNCLHYLLKAIRKQKQRAILVDTTGILTECYYRPNQDILLNPLDIRGAPWHPWIECTDKTSYAAMAESFIPQSLSEHDNYWRTLARNVFDSLLNQLENSRKNSTLAAKLLCDPLEELCDLVKGTKQRLPLI